MSTVACKYDFIRKRKTSKINKISHKYKRVPLAKKTINKTLNIPKERLGQNLWDSISLHEIKSILNLKVPNQEQHNVGQLCHHRLFCLP